MGTLDGRFPPCSVCGSEGYPADFYHQGMPIKTMRNPQGDEIAYVDYQENFFCWDCGLKHLPLADMAPDQLEVLRYACLSFRMDPDSRSYRGEE